MSGMIIPILTKREYDFSNGTATIVAAKVVDVSQFTEGSVLVRVHDKNITNTTGTIEVKARTTCPSSEDPSVDFLGENVATALINTLTSSPALVVGGFTADFGGYVQVTVVGSKGNSATIKSTISVDLVVKD